MKEIEVTEKITIKVGETSLVLTESQARIVYLKLRALYSTEEKIRYVPFPSGMYQQLGPPPGQFIPNSNPWFQPHKDTDYCQGMGASQCLQDFIDKGMLV